MAGLITLLEQHLDRQPATDVTQATIWWETVFAVVKLKESGLGVHLPVEVWYTLLRAVLYFHLYTINTILENIYMYRVSLMHPGFFMSVAYCEGALLKDNIILQ